MQVPVYCNICSWAPARISSWGGPARLVGHSTDSSRALSATRRKARSPGRTTGGSNAAVTFVTAGIAMFGCDTIRVIKGSRGGAEVTWAGRESADASTAAAKETKVQWRQDQTRDLGRGSRIRSVNHHEIGRAH